MNLRSIKKSKSNIIFSSLLLVLVLSSFICGVTLFTEQRVSNIDPYLQKSKLNSQNQNPYINKGYMNRTTTKSKSSLQANNYNLLKKHLQSVKLPAAQIIQSQSMMVSSTNPISINGNADFITQAGNNNWQGAGIKSSPYILKDLVIQTTSSSAISIKNTNLYFTIQNCSLQGTYGLNLYNVSSGLIKNNTLSNNSQNGMYLYLSNNNSFVNNTVNNNAGGFYLVSSSFNNLTGNELDSNTQPAVQIYASSNNNTFNDNIATNNAGGFNIYNSVNTSLQGNSAIQNQGGNGFSFSYSYNNTLTDNIEKFGNYGFSISSSANNTLEGNMAVNNTEDYYISSSNSSIVEKNVAINSSTAGIELLDSNESLVLNNTVNSNVDGIILSGSSTSDVVTNNTALNILADNFMVELNANGNTLTGNTAKGGDYGFLVLGLNNLLVNNREDSFYTTDNPVIFSPMTTYYGSTTLQLNYTSPITRLLLYLDTINNNTLVNGTFLNNLSEGEHNFTIYVMVSSNVYIQRVLFTVDTIKPQITILSPAVGTYNINSTLLNYTILELHPLKTTIIIDGLKNYTLMQPGSTLKNLSNGDHNLTILVLDKAGNDNFTSVIFTINVQSTTASNTSTTTTATTSTTTTSTSSIQSSSDKTTDSSMKSTSHTKTSPGFTMYSIIFVAGLINILIYKRKRKQRKNE